MRFTVIAISAMALTVHAGPLTWVLNNVTFPDGVTASGSFTFDADAGTACSSASSPCGTYSNVDIMTTAAGAFPAETFVAVCGDGAGFASYVPSCTGVSPDSTEVLLLTSTAADQTGLPGLAIFFTGVGAVPPAGLTDAGGTIDVSDSSLSVGALSLGYCNDSSCASANELVGNDAGSVSAPEPSSVLLLAASLAVLGLVKFLRFPASRRES